MKKKIKFYSILSVLVLCSIGIAFATGTFHPNTFVKKDIIENVKQEMMLQWKELGLKEPSIEYSSNTEFVQAVNRCVQWVNLGLEPDQRIPREIILSMAVLETGYGTSRFAIEGNNLFGIRTWDPETPQLKAKGNPDAEWGVRVYPTKCASVQNMIDIINRHPAYEGFRKLRIEQAQNNSVDINALTHELHKWSTNPDYTKIVISKFDKIESILKNGT